MLHAVELGDPIHPTIVLLHGVGVLPSSPQHIEPPERESIPVPDMSLVRQEE